jgi:hypothetical protein
MAEAERLANQGVEVTKPEGKQARLRQVNPSGTVRRVEAADIAA